MQPSAAQYAAGLGPGAAANHPGSSYVMRNDYWTSPASAAAAVRQFPYYSK